MVDSEREYSHESPDYDCPFCRFLEGGESTYNRRSDVVYEDEAVTALISPHWWEGNPGHVLVIPNQHEKNIYGIPDDQLAAVHVIAKRIALAMKEAYDCDGITIRQHNEPAGNQEVFHLHVHVIPRYEGDGLYYSYDDFELAKPEERAGYAERLRALLV